MRSNRTEKFSANMVAAWLTLRVHIDAFRFDPAAYLTAAKWWFKRKRLRARGQFAPLLGQSPKAYRLWALRQDRAGRAYSPHDAAPSIVALVDGAIDGRAGAGRVRAGLVRAGLAKVEQRALAATLRSLEAEGVPWLLVGEGHESLTLAATHIPWDAQPWLMPLGAGDRLAPGAAAAYRVAIAEAQAQAGAPDAGEGGDARLSVSGLPRILFADDDQLDRRNRRADPHFKPDWNSELFAHHDYLTGACIVQATRADLAAVGQGAAAGADETGRDGSGPDGTGWAQRLVARVAMTEQGAGHDGPQEGGQGAAAPVHVRAMLHHRCARIAPRLPAAPVIVARDLPPVTIIVPTRNRVDLLRTCLEGVAATDYPQVDVIVVDNDSDDAATLAYLAALDPARHQVLRHSGPFNYSAINNRAAAQAQGRLLCLLNNDIEMIAPDWLAIMAIQALRADVGAVGARLLYPDGRIQHAGVVIGVGGGAAHAHRFVQPDAQGYFHRHALPQFTSAVTGACLLVQRARFAAVGGLDEGHFAVAFNDVDLCLRLNQRGWQSLYEPHATLIHHESVSRGLDRDPVGAARFAGELAALKRIWKTDAVVDPWHHPALSREAEQFVVAI